MNEENEKLHLGDVMCMGLNLNNYIKVKLTEKGRELLAEEHNEYIGVIPKWEKRTAQYYKDQEDEQGFTKFQAWSFIQQFGKVTGMGMPCYYETEIQMEMENLKPYT